MLFIVKIDAGVTKPLYQIVKKIMWVCFNLIPLGSVSSNHLDPTYKRFKWPYKIRIRLYFSYYAILTLFGGHAKLMQFHANKTLKVAKNYRLSHKLFLKS